MFNQVEHRRRKIFVKRYISSLCMPKTTKRLCRKSQLINREKLMLILNFYRQTDDLVFSNPNCYTHTHARLYFCVLPLNSLVRDLSLVI